MASQAIGNVEEKRLSYLQSAVERVRSFVETYGLYRKLPIEEIFEGLEEVVNERGPFRFSGLSPRVALLECSVCRRERTFESRIVLPILLFLAFVACGVIAGSGGGN